MGIEEERGGKGGRDRMRSRKIRNTNRKKREEVE